MSKKIARDYLRKEILRFTKGKDLKEPWKIEKLVRYNDKEHPNEQGHDTGETSGMYKLGTTIRPSENGYTMIHWTILKGKVEWNAEIHFNKKMTPMCGHINTFMGSPLVYDGEKVSKEYLCQLIDEGTWVENYFSEENGFTFKQLFSVGGGVLEVEEVTEEEDDIEDNDPEEYGEYTWKEGLTAEEIAKGDTIDALTGEPIEK
jgi:hypothetical protein